MVVFLVLPVIGVALVVRLLHRALTPSDDWQAAVAGIRATGGHPTYTERNTEKHT